MFVAPTVGVAQHALELDRRGHLRVAAHVPVELRCRSARGPYLLFSGHLQSVSATGSGLTILGPVAAPVRRSELVGLRVQLGDQLVELPAQVAWFRSASRYDDMVDLGLELRLELAPAATRAAYATWLARLTAGAAR